MNTTNKLMLLALFIFGSCQNESRFISFLDNNLGINDFETILLIPISNGCDGCVKEALNLQADFKLLIYSDTKDSLIYVNDKYSKLKNIIFLKKKSISEKDMFDLHFPNRVIKKGKEIKVQVLKAPFFQ